MNREIHETGEPGQRLSTQRRKGAKAQIWWGVSLRARRRVDWARRARGDAPYLSSLCLFRVIRVFRGHPLISAFSISAFQFFSFCLPIPQLSTSTFQLYGVVPVSR